MFTIGYPNVKLVYYPRLAVKRALSLGSSVISELTTPTWCNAHSTSSTVVEGPWNAPSYRDNNTVRGGTRGNVRYNSIQQV